MLEVEIYHAKCGHSGMKNNIVMTVLVIYEGEGEIGLRKKISSKDK